MITEDYVSFETAELLKEKGFNESTSMVYMSYGDLCKCTRYDSICNSSYNDITKNYFECTAPTLQRAMKWLRKVHKIHIQIWILEEKGYWFNIEKILNAQYKHKSLYSSGLEDIYFETYEEAVEAAIKYCLENLI